MHRSAAKLPEKSDLLPITTPILLMHCQCLCYLLRAPCWGLLRSETKNFFTLDNGVDRGEGEVFLSGKLLSRILIREQGRKLIQNWGARLRC